MRFSELGDIRSSTPARSASIEEENQEHSLQHFFNLEPENKCHRRHTSDNHHHTYFSFTNNPRHYQLSSPSHTIHRHVPLDRTSEPPISVPGTYHDLKEKLSPLTAHQLPLARFHKTRATRPPRRQRNSNDSASTSSKGIKHKTSYLPLRAFHVLYCEQNKKGVKGLTSRCSPSFAYSSLPRKRRERVRTAKTKAPGRAFWKAVFDSSPISASAHLRSNRCLGNAHEKAIAMRRKK